MKQKQHWKTFNFMLLYIITFSLYLVSTQETCPENTFTCEADYTSDYYGAGALNDAPHGSYGYHDTYEESSYGTDDNYGSTESTSLTCLSKSLRCNGESDCNSCSDERNCTEPTVFWCGNDPTSGSCIPLDQRCDNHTDCYDGSDECDCPGSLRCSDQSSSTKCVSAASICDGKADCPDGEDELTCAMYVCPNNKEIVETKLCDGINDCADNIASDECNCSSTFVCDTGLCISNSKVCDGEKDCPDGTDECDCVGEDGTSSFYRCEGSRICIERNRVCDGKLDCGNYVTPENATANQRSHYVMDCSDESAENCASHFMCADAKEMLLTGIINRDLKSCVTSIERCDGRSQCDDASDECDCHDSVACPLPDNFNEPAKRCMLRRNFCDATEDCSGGLDEKTIGFGFKCRPGLSHTQTTACILPQYMVEDGIADCGNEADICYRNGKWRCFRCVDNSMIIADEQVCDGIVDCPDLSDECMCSRERPQVCDFVCGMDGTNTCSKGTIKCENSPDNNNSSFSEKGYISFSSICNSVNDCPLGSSDEFFDENSCLREMESVPDMTCPVGGITNPLRPLYASRCDGRPECSDFADECDPKNPCPVVPKFCERVSDADLTLLRGGRRFLCSKGFVNTSKTDSFFGLPGGLVCNGVIDCAVHGEDELFCPQRYTCETGDNMSSIDVRQKCDGRADCRDGSDEMNCTEYFYCENGDPLFVPKSVRFDGRDDCSDKSDECPKEQLEGAFASKAEMIANPFLSALVWIMATISTVGNIAVIIHQIMIFVKHKKHGGQNVALCNRVMILNLACADLLTGVYLFILAGKILHFSGAYCHQDKFWRTSTACADLGLLNSIATESAVVILVIMTTYRLLAVYKPFYTTSVRPEKVALLCVSSWIFVISLMMIPRLHGLSGYFSDTAWYPLPFFDGDVVNRSTIVKFIQRYNVITGNINSTTENNWLSVEKFVQEKHFNESRFALFGYYSKHSVCIPNMLAGYGDAGVGFSAFITGFNLCAFCYVVTAYIFIYKGAVEKTGGMNKQYSINNSYVMRSYSTKPLTGDRESSKSNIIRASSSKSTAMQRRIYRLVASNLACWLPLTIMAVANLFGAKLSNDAYAVAAIVLLPITSALNPLVYSNFVSVAWVKMKQFCLCMKRKDDAQAQDPMPVTDRSQLSTSVKSAKV